MSDHQDDEYQFATASDVEPQESPSARLERARNLDAPGPEVNETPSRRRSTPFAQLNVLPEYLEAQPALVRRFCVGCIKNLGKSNAICTCSSTPAFHSLIVMTDAIKPSTKKRKEAEMSDSQPAEEMDVDTATEMPAPGKVVKADFLEDSLCRRDEGACPRCSKAKVACITVRTILSLFHSALTLYSALRASAAVPTFFCTSSIDIVQIPLPVALIASANTPEIGLLLSKLGVDMSPRLRKRWVQNCMHG